MFHPILNRLWKIAIYLGIWILIAFWYFNFISENFELETYLNVLETIINLTLIITLNLGIWFILKFRSIDDKSNFNIILNHITTAIGLSAFWIFISWLIMTFISPNKDAYSKLFSETLVIKTSAGIISYFLSVFFYYIVIYYQNNKENINRKNELALMLQKQELNNLKEQINPHFLFNSLNSISYLIYSNPDDAHNSIVKLSEYFRYSLKLEKSITSVKEEIDNINRYFEIEKIRFSNKMKIIFDVDDSCLNYNIPVMLLQPLAENAIKHGVYENTELTEITVSIKDKEDFYTINFSNTFDPEAIPRRGTGTGLKNIGARLSLIYKRSDLMTVKKSDNVFKVKLLIPKQIES